MKLSNYLIPLLALGFAGCAHSSKNENFARTPANDDDIFVSPDLMGFDPSPDNVEQDRMGVSHTVLQERGGRSSAPLERCHGKATLGRENGQLMLHITGAGCSNVITKYGIQKLRGKGNTNRSIDVAFDSSPGWHQVTIGSIEFVNKQGTSGNGDNFYVYIPTQAVSLNLNSSGVTRDYHLPNCNGAIRAKISQGVVNLIVAQSTCAYFDIVANDGSTIKYDARPFPAQSRGYGGSFAIPARFYRVDGNGNNYVQIRLYTPYFYEDRVAVSFHAQ